MKVVMGNIATAMMESIEWAVDNPNLAAFMTDNVKKAKNMGGDIQSVYNLGHQSGAISYMEYPDANARFEALFTKHCIMEVSDGQ